MKRTGIVVIVVAWSIWFTLWYAGGQRANAVCIGITERLPGGSTVSRQAAAEALEVQKNSTYRDATSTSIIPLAVLTIGMAFVVSKSKPRDGTT